jgi:Cytochrome C'
MIRHERNDLVGRIAFAAAAVACLACIEPPRLHAQAAPAGRGGPARGAASAQHADATLAQLMKGIFFTNSNVVFAAQNQNPADVPPAKDPSVATDPLTNSYGKWEAVENSGLALAEGANLLTLPGRKCSNGRPVPLANADWAKLVQGMREAGLKVYAAAKAKDQDKILDAADTMTNACSNCHDKYREKATAAERCK